MASDEMETITADKWTDDVWGISNSQDPMSRLFFYFGRNDHWVAERTRDEIIELRGQKPPGPKMTVCEEGVPHAFCLSEWFLYLGSSFLFNLEGLVLILMVFPVGHSDLMASKVADMIMEMARA